MVEQQRLAEREEAMRLARPAEPVGDATYTVGDATYTVGEASDATYVVPSTPVRNPVLSETYELTPHGSDKVCIFSVFRKSRPFWVFIEKGFFKKGF